MRFAVILSKSQNAVIIINGRSLSLGRASQNSCHEPQVNPSQESREDAICKSIMTVMTNVNLPTNKLGPPYEFLAQTIDFFISASELNMLAVNH